MDIDALVLLGGKSKRMNGNNKAFLQYNDKTFLDNITEALEDFNEIYFSVDSKEKYKHLNSRLVEDEYKDIGPIGGLYSTLKVMSSDYVFVTACDMPKMNKEYINFIIDNLDQDDDCVVVKDSKDRLYPLGGIYSKKILPVIEEMIYKEDYKLANLVNNINSKVLELNDVDIDEGVLINVNDPKEYQKLNN